MNILLVTHFLNGFLMIAMPLALAIYLTRRWKMGWRFWLVGAAVFILSQVGHIPFNMGITALFQSGILPPPPNPWTTIFNAIVLGLSAGLFEEFARYAMYRWWIKDARSGRKGILAGAGHGGAEAIILGIIVLFVYLQMVIVRNPGVLAALPDARAAEVKAQLDAFWSIPWPLSLIGALERFFTIPTQIALSVMVLQTFIRKQGFWIWLAILYHALLDAIVVILGTSGQIFLPEAVVGGFGVLSLIIIFWLCRTEPVAEQPEPPHIVPVETLS